MTEQNTSMTLPSAIEQALIMGDLSGLKTPDRIIYYNHLCQSLGLNPLTKPFNYIMLNGKLTLYASKDCTDQLRSLRGVSVTALESKIDGDLCIVTATGKDKTGRTDCATGAVDMKNLVGEKKANALMKAETKAKRRLTLSLCGLGMVDESEVGSIEGAKVVDEKFGAKPVESAKPATVEASTFAQQVREQAKPAPAVEAIEEIEFAPELPEVPAQKAGAVAKGSLDELRECLEVASSSASVKSAWKDWRASATATDMNDGYSIYKSALSRVGGA